VAKTNRKLIGELVVPVFVPSVLFSIGENALIPLIPASAENLGADLATASLIAGLLMFGVLVADLPAAKFLAAVGERRAMMWASYSAAIGVAFVGLADSLITMSIGVFLIGACASVFGLARHTYIAAHVPFGIRARALSILGGMFRAGGVFGPLLAASLIAIGDVKIVYWVAVALCVGAGALVFTTKSDQTADKANQMRHGTWHITKREWKKLSTLGVASALLSIVRTARIIGLPLWALHLDVPVATATLFIGIAASLDLVLFYTSGQVMDKWGRRAAAVPTMFMLGLTMFLLPLTTDEWGILWIGLAMSIANGLGSGLIMVLGADLAPADARGEFLAAFHLMIDGSTSLTAPILALAAVTVGLGYGFIFVGFLSLVGSWLMWKHIPLHIQAPKKSL
jgi:MFS family permease